MKELDWKLARTALLGICALNTAAASAAGFRLPDASIAGLGVANAMVANPEDIGAMPYNPAAMAFHTGFSVSGGALAFWTYMDTSSAGNNASIDVSRPAYAPVGYASGPISGPWRWGIGITAPFGLQTNWRAGSFPAFAAAGVAGLEPARSKIEMFNVNPNVSYQLLGPTGKLQPGVWSVSVAAGADYYHVREAQLDSQAVGLKGDGHGWGWNAAVLASNGAWSFGLSHRSSVEVDVDGKVTAGPFSGRARTEVEFPSMTQAGVRWKVSKSAAVEFDVEYTRWSSFDRITVNHANVAVPTPIVNTNAWKNAWTYRLGFTLDASQATRLRLGYAYDKTPLNPDHFNARLPDNNRHIFTAGASHAFQAFTMDIGYSYTRFNSRNYNTSVPFGTFGADPNGTHLFNGSYKAHVHVLGIGITKQF